MRHKRSQRLAYPDWCEEVDRLCTRHLYLDWEGLSGDEEPLQVGYMAGETPMEFVEGVARRYELAWM